VIGVAVLVLLAIELGSYIPLIGLVPYVLLFINRRASFVALYIYLLLLFLFLPVSSVYSFSTLAVAASVLLVLDDVLRGSLRPQLWELFAIGGLIASLAYTSAFPFVVLGVTGYALYRRFGRGVMYLGGWFVVSTVLLLLLRSRLGTWGSEAMAIVGVGVILLLIAERRVNVEVETEG